MMSGGPETETYREGKIQRQKLRMILTITDRQTNTRLKRRKMKVWQSMSGNNDKQENLHTTCLPTVCVLVATTRCQYRGCSMGPGIH